MVEVLTLTKYHSRMPVLNLPLEYAEAFLNECMDHGLSKEASISLLGAADMRWRLDNEPGYADGWRDELVKAAGEDYTTPMVTGGLTAAGLAALILSRGKIGRGLRVGGKAVADAMAGTGAAVIPRIAGAGNWVGRKAIVPAVEGSWNLVKNAPTSVKTVGGLTLAGTGAGYMVANDRDNQSWVNKLDSRMGEKFDPASSRQVSRQLLNDSTKRLAELNTSSYDKALKIQELRKAINSGAPGASSAVQELHQLEQAKALEEKQLDVIRGGIRNDMSNHAAYAGKISKQIDEEMARDQSAWTKFRRFLGHHALPGGMDGGDYYNNRIRKLTAEGLDNMQDMGMSGEAMRRATTGYGGSLPLTSSIASSPPTVTDTLRS